MRYEVIRLVQFLFSLGLIAAAFAGGLGVGWWRWGRARRSVPHHGPTGATHEAAVARQDLFAPELDLDGEVWLAPRSDRRATRPVMPPVAELPRITAPAASTGGRD